MKNQIQSFPIYALYPRFLIWALDLTAFDLHYMILHTFTLPNLDFNLHYMILHSIPFSNSVPLRLGNMPVIGIGPKSNLVFVESCGEFGTMISMDDECMIVFNVKGTINSSFKYCFSNIYNMNWTINNLFFFSPEA